MAPEFDMKKVTTPLLLHMLGKELRFPRLFLLLRRLTLARFKNTIDKRFPQELIDLAALPVWVYLNPSQQTVTKAFGALAHGRGEGLRLYRNYRDRSCGLRM